MADSTHRTPGADCRAAAPRPGPLGRLRSRMPLAHLLPNSGVTGAPSCRTDAVTARVTHCAVNSSRSSWRSQPFCAQSRPRQKSTPGEMNRAGSCCRSTRRHPAVRRRRLPSMAPMPTAPPAKARQRRSRWAEPSSRTGSGGRRDGAARAARSSPDLVRAVIRVESGWNPRARSDKGAQGLMQLMPGTAAEYGVTNPFDPEQNIRGGVAYLEDADGPIRRQTELALAAYNAGPGAVEKYGRTIPPYRETQAYVRKIVSVTEVQTRAEQANLQDRRVDRRARGAAVFGQEARRHLRGRDEPVVDLARPRRRRGARRRCPRGRTASLPRRRDRRPHPPARAAPSSARWRPAGRSVGPLPARSPCARSRPTSAPGIRAAR